MASPRTATRRDKSRTATVVLGLAAVVMTACTTSPHLLTQDEDWQLEVLAGPRLELSAEDGDGSRTQGVSDYTRPVTLNEAVAFGVPRAGDEVTLLTGPVHDEARAVRIASIDGESADATLDVAHGLTWFWATLPGSQQISAITAYDADGEIVDEYTLPSMPPPDQAPVPAPEGP